MSGSVDVHQDGSTMLGWVASPAGRGTFDILTSCFQTIFLCAWVSVCINLPASGRRTRDYLRDKFHFVLLTLGGPELVFMLAFGQQQSASRSVQAFAELGFRDWTLTHGFYADMGGIVVRPRGWKAFPVNAAQVHFLVQNKYMDYPRINLGEIKMRAKSDGLARLITLVQTIYFVITSLARVVQGLAITTLELTVLGFIFCTIATTICWWSKPCDVEEGHYFDLHVTIEEILLTAGDAAKQIYHDTPLDFVCHQQIWYGSLVWQLFVNNLRHLHFLAAQSKPRPTQKISSFNFPRPTSIRSEVVMFVISVIYCSTFCYAWYMQFPTTIERDIWRAVSVTQIVLCLAGVFEGVSQRLDDTARREAVQNTGNRESNDDIEHGCGWSSIRTGLSRLWSKPYNNSVLKLPTQDVPMRTVLITTPLGAVYVVCRWFVLVEDIIGLRSTPASAFLTVDWTRYWPSF